MRLTDAETIPPVLRAVATGWDHDCVEFDPDAPVFYSIAGIPGTALFQCDSHLDDRRSRQFDAVNAVCDAVSVLASALPAERPDLICLHAAGVAILGRMVVFPNIRKAGKSTLSAALAMAGFALFSDDVIPVFFTADGQARGLAMGMAPRLRLPLHDSFGAAFCQWVDQVAGPANRQYQYLAVESQPAHGATSPIGAYVILDRQDDPVPACLVDVPPDAAMDALLHQNFTRDRHSGDILQAVAASLRDRPVYRLTYSMLSDAVSCLGAAFQHWENDCPPVPDGPVRLFRLARFDGPDRPAPTEGALIRQRAGTVAERIGDTLYLADPEGLAIHRMDPLAAAIWAVLQEPVTAQDIQDLLIEAFPATEPARVKADLHRLLKMLHEAGLIEPAVLA